MQASDPPPTVTERADQLADRLAAAPGVLLCLDFDGTLAPIVEDPDEATISPACKTAVASLAGRANAEVAIVSGRGIRDLRDRVGLDTVVYAGNHGLELRRSDETEVHPEARDKRPVIEAVSEEIADRTAEIPGAEVENKRVTATVHYRQVPDGYVGDVVGVVDDVADSVSADLEVNAGKQIREVRPAVPWDKGAVVEELASDVPEDWEVVYVGDDTTDEDAFEVVEPDGLAVHVGRGEETTASYRVEDQSAVVEFLELVAEHVD